MAGKVRVLCVHDVLRMSRLNIHIYINMNINSIGV